MAKREIEYEYYVDGNTVRKYAAEPYEIPEQEEHKERKPKHKKKKARRQAYGFGYTLMLVVAVGFVAMACASLISVQAEIQNQRRQIAALKSELETVKDDNDATTSRISRDLDLEAIFKTATEELGMVYPGKGQIVTYEHAKEQYVRQFQDVPDAE